MSVIGNKYFTLFFLGCKIIINIDNSIVGKDIAIQIQVLMAVFLDKPNREGAKTGSRNPAGYLQD